MLIRDVPPAVLRWMDARAARMRLSRSELLRRQLVAWAGQDDTATISAADWDAFDATFADLADPEVMARAWQ